MKNIVRRVAAVIVIFSFFLPWFDLLFFRVSGFKLISASFQIGATFYEPGFTIFGVVALIIVIAALWTLIQPKLLPSLILFILSVGVFVTFYGLSETDQELILNMGVYVLAIGSFGILISFFLKNVAVTTNRTIHIGVQEATATNQTSGLELTTASPESEQFFCTNCGIKVSANSRFCYKCGTNLAN